MSLYPDITPYRTGTLKLTDGHTMYYEESGNPKGKPMVYLHGGPGSGISSKHRRYANPKTTRIITFAQRGCSPSKPFGSLIHNTTPHLISDIERLREHLGIHTWYVVGFSWGCTLALAYAQTHPQCVLALTVGGVFLGTRREMNWLFGPDGAARFYPQAYQNMCESVLNPPSSKLASTLLHVLQNPKSPQAQKVASLVGIYEMLACELNPDYATIQNEARAGPEAVFASRILLHYDVHDNFLQPNQLLNNISRIAHIPLFIVQGALDMVCPPESALALHAAHPNSQLYWVELCGHRANKAGLQSRVRAIRDMLKKVPAPA